MPADPVAATLDFLRTAEHYLGPVVWLLTLLLLAELVNLVSLRKLNALGIRPREVAGLPGILLSPLLHLDLAHFGANVVPLALLSFALGQLMPAHFWWILCELVVGTGLAVWLLGRGCLHVGASGVVFGLFGFLTVHGFSSGNLLHFSVALLLLAMYAGLLWGVLPTTARTSWESHLAGLCVGAGLAWWRVY